MARPRRLPTVVITGNPQFVMEPGPPWIVLLRKPFQIDDFRTTVLALMRAARASTAGRSWPRAP